MDKSSQKINNDLEARVTAHRIVLCATVKLKILVRFHVYVVQHSLMMVN